MSDNIAKLNMKAMMRVLHGEMKRIQGLKCPADVRMVEDHSKKLESLNNRTIRIEAMAVATVALVTLFGIIVGCIQYSNYKLAKEQASKEKTYPAVVQKQDIQHGIY